MESLHLLRYSQAGRYSNCGAIQDLHQIMGLDVRKQVNVAKISLANRIYHPVPEGMTPKPVGEIEGNLRDGIFAYFGDVEVEERSVVFILGPREDYSVRPGQIVG